MLTRTVNCKHKYGCYENVVISFHKVFFKSFAIKTAFNSLFYLGSIRKLFLKLFDSVLLADTCRFALFFSLMNSVYKMILCLLRRLCANDRVNALIAGFCAGLVSSLEKKNRREFMLFLVLSRLVDTLINVGEDRRAYTRR